MKGIESIIAIILVLMIVIALAALAYTWFSGIFASLTSTAGSAMTTTTSNMNTEISIDSAKNISSTSNQISLVVRNTGNANFNITGLAAYVSDTACTVPLLIGSMIPGNYTGFTITNCPTCNVCNGHICYLSTGAMEIVTITISTGLQTSAIVVC
jgi:flagellin-like protein